MAFAKAFYYLYKNVKKKVDVLKKCTGVGDECISAAQPGRLLNSVRSFSKNPDRGGNPEDRCEDYVFVKPIGNWLIDEPELI